MKVIFLDIDGVLNSVRYDRERRPDDEKNIDESRLPLLKNIIDRTGAKIVLISSWRKHWNREAECCDAIGKGIADTFRQFGVEIMDKTPEIASRERAEEIHAWLDPRRDQVEAFVILDDKFGGWGDLADRLVKTDRYIGRGLEERHVQLAVEKLDRSVWTN